MPIHEKYHDYITDLLKIFGSITMKRMFGSTGLNHQGAIFGLVADNMPTAR